MWVRRLTERAQAPLHKQLAIPALKAKKDVFVEWPLANGLQEAEELAALAKKQGVKTVVGLQARLAPSILKVSLTICLFHLTVSANRGTHSRAGQRNHRFGCSRSHYKY